MVDWEMRLGLEINSLTWRNPDAPASPLASITVRRGDVIPIDVLVFSGVTRTELAGEASGVLQLNPANSFGTANKIADDSTMEKVGAGREAVYSFTLSVNGSGVTALFPDANTASAKASLELQITNGEHVTSSEPLAVTIQNALIHA